MLIGLFIVAILMNMAALATLCTTAGQPILYSSISISIISLISMPIFLLWYLNKTAE